MAKLNGTGAALLYSTTQTKLEMVEEKHGDVTLVGYRFPDGGQYTQDVNNIRYNFTPCFARVGNQFVVASTLELGHELVGLLQKEAERVEKGQRFVGNQHVYATGIADILSAFEEQLIAQAILDHGLPPDDAKAQVRDFISIVRRLGGISLQSDYQKNEFRLDVRLSTSK